MTIFWSHMILGVKERAFYCQLGWSYDVGLLSENYHNINLVASENLLLNEGVVPLLWILLTPPH